MPGHNFVINDKTKRLDGIEEELSFTYNGYYALENEYIIFRACTVKYINGGYTCDKRKFYLLNLTDSFRLEKVYGEKNTKAEDFYRLVIRYKNYTITTYGNLVLKEYDVKTKYNKTSLNNDNAKIEGIYKALTVLRSTFDPAEAGDTKLTKFKNEYQQPGVSKEVSEEQRRYIVQANAANTAKDYVNAVLLYRKALDINRFSYPDAYFNMALILSTMEWYYQAIYAMKAYLILSPNAEDARKAQDKIYEWELNLKY